MSDHDTVRKAHADAMTALAADVHPYSAQAIRDHEEAMDAALDRLVAERDEARREFVQIPTTAQILRAEAAKAGDTRAVQDAESIRKVEAYDAARAEVKRNGHSRAEYVLRAEAAEAERDEARKLLHGLTNEADANSAWKALILRAEVAEAERDRLREALTAYVEDDCRELADGEGLTTEEARLTYSPRYRWGRAALGEEA